MPRTDRGRLAQENRKTISVLHGSGAALLHGTLLSSSRTMATAEMILESLRRFETQVQNTYATKESVKSSVDDLQNKIDALTNQVNGLTFTTQEAQQEYEQMKVNHDYRIRELESKIQSKGTDHRNDLVDRKDLLPERWNGKGIWKVWTQEMREYVGCWNRELGDAMKTAETCKTTITPEMYTGANITYDQDRQLRSFISGRVVKGTTSGEIVEQGVAHNLPGLEVWRRMSEHFAPLLENRKVEAAMTVMNPGRASSLHALAEKLPAWENNFEELQQRYNESLPASYKIGILYKMMPTDLENELMKDQFKYTTYESLRSAVLMIIHQRSKGAAPMIHNCQEAEPAGHNEDCGPEFEEEDGMLYRLERNAQGKWEKKRVTKGKGKGGGKSWTTACYRRGREGHHQNECIAKTHVEGGPPKERPKGGKGGRAGKGANNLEETLANTEDEQVGEMNFCISLNMVADYEEISSLSNSGPEMINDISSISDKRPPTQTDASCTENDNICIPYVGPSSFTQCTHNPHSAHRPTDLKQSWYHQTGSCSWLVQDAPRGQSSESSGTTNRGSGDGVFFQIE